MTRLERERDYGYGHGERVGEKLLTFMSRGKVKTLRASEWFVNKNTELGEPADYYEIKPHGGKKWIANKDIVSIEVEACKSNS